MRIVLSALAAAALIAGSAAAVDAQQMEPTAQGKSATKVYSYQQKNINTKTPDINTYHSSQQTPARLPSNIPYASDAWWLEMQNTAPPGE